MDSEIQADMIGLGCWIYLIVKYWVAQNISFIVTLNFIPAPAHRSACSTGTHVEEGAAMWGKAIGNVNRTSEMMSERILCKM